MYLGLLVDRSWVGGFKKKKEQKEIRKRFGSEPVRGVFFFDYAQAQIILRGYGKNESEKVRRDTYEHFATATSALFTRLDQALNRVKTEIVPSRSRAVNSQKQ